MKRAKYVVLLLLVFILIAIGIIILFPKTENIVDKRTTLNNLYQKDSINNIKVNEKSINYEIINLKAITSENDYSSPIFSPDGKKIAITNSNFKGITVKNMEDGTKKRITEDEGAGFRFSWSPDSKAITYLSRTYVKGESINIIKIVEIDNGNAFKLTTPGIGASMPTFIQSNEVIYSYKGTLIKRKWSNGTISNEEILAENIPANIINPSPKKDKLIIEDDEGIKIMDNHGENRKIIVKNGDKDFACDSKVSFDGNKVLFANNIGSIGHLFIYDITNKMLIDIGEGYFGQWLTNGKIIYCITYNDGNVITSSEIFIINSDGSGKKKITNTQDQIEIQPSVSPDGKSIAYRDDKTGKIYYGILEIIK